MNPRLLRPLASGFTPRRIAGIVGWWAADASPLFQEPNGTAAVTADNESVGYWGDLSGNGHHLLPLSGASTTQTNNNVRPKYKTGTLNGLPTIQFSASGANTLGRAFTLAQPCHYFYVYRYDTDITGGARAFDGFNVNAAILRNSVDNLVINAGVGNRNWFGTQSLVESFGVWDLSLDATNTVLRRSGVAGSDTSGTGSNNPSGIRLAVFQNGSAAPGNVSFAEMIIYNRILSATEAAAVRRYLGTKYSLAFA
jgi:hypothetical protein